jgi:CheY-like chemotaxis protein
VRTSLEARSAIVMGDRTQLQNALLNLALNARDFMPNGGDLTFSSAMARGDEPILSSQSNTSEKIKYFIVSVSDTGIGMEDHVKKRIFEPFFTTKPAGKGTGLGLASVYGTVTNHGGFIEVHSEFGSGTRFSMYLPASDTGIPVVAFKTSVIEKGIGKILVIDDEKLIREMASEILRELGYSIVTSIDGEEAVRYFNVHNREIELVLLDIAMPKMGGYDCFMRLKAINPSVKVIVFSGYSIDEEAQRILDQGALAFIQKPFDIQGLTEAIGRLKINKNPAAVPNPQGG